MGSEKGKPEGPKQPYWLVYLAALVAGAMLLADAANYMPAERVTARLGVGLVYSAFALFVGNGRPAGFVATALLWMALIVTFLV